MISDHDGVTRFGIANSVPSVKTFAKVSGATVIFRQANPSPSLAQLNSVTGIGRIQVIFSGRRLHPAPYGVSI